ncbi:hypothetical protein O9992_30405 [Vibrio lentus]|nr:hypothetical protein [Vibrio lentus]
MQRFQRLNRSSDASTHNIELRAVTTRTESAVASGMYVDATLTTSESNTVNQCAFGGDQLHIVTAILYSFGPSN